jgi:hypothetical protein
MGTRAGIAIAVGLIVGLLICILWDLNAITGQLNQIQQVVAP